MTPTPPVIAAERRRPVWPLTAGLVLLALTAVLFQFNPSQYGFYPRCLLYTNTGIYCPGCGALRAVHQLTHGHLAAAARDNPLLVLSLPFVAYYLLRFISQWITGEPLPAPVLRRGGLVVFLVVLALFTILRNIPYFPFYYLSPP